jgi:hypothetical protein
VSRPQIEPGNWQEVRKGIRHHLAVMLIKVRVCWRKRAKAYRDAKRNGLVSDQLEILDSLAGPKSPRQPRWRHQPSVRTFEK